MKARRLCHAVAALSKRTAKSKTPSNSMDITNPKLLKFKGLLFLLLGIISGCLLLAVSPAWEVFLLLVICIWAFCRFYYFAFYVIDCLPKIIAEMRK